MGTTRADTHIPAGVLQGDDKPMRDCGTGCGVTDTYGADLGPESTNRMGGISGATKSDSGGLINEDQAIDRNGTMAQIREEAAEDARGDEEDE